MARCYQPNDVLGLNKLQLPGCDDKNHLSLSFAARQAGLLSQSSMLQFIPMCLLFVRFLYHRIERLDSIQVDN